MQKDPEPPIHPEACRTGAGRVATLLLLLPFSLAGVRLASADPAPQPADDLCPAGYAKSFCASTAKPARSAAASSGSYRRFGLPSAMRRTLPDADIDSAAPTTGNPRLMPQPDAREEPALVTRIRGLEDLAVVTFWKTEGAKIYMGLDDGRPGIHLKQLGRTRD